MNYLTNKYSSHISVDTILSLHYFECSDIISGPSRGFDFTELIYIENGTVAVETSTGIYHLKTGDALFHNANIVYQIIPTSESTATITTCAFLSSSYTKHFFENEIFHFDKRAAFIINELVLEAYNSYTADINKYQQVHMTIVPAAIFGAEQVLHLLLEYLLIYLIRKKDYSNHVSEEQEYHNNEVLKSLGDEETLQRIISYMEDKINEKLTIDKICKDNLISQSKLQKLFKSKTGKGVIDYFLETKINVAKLLISEHVWNFTQISEHLGYTSVHFFSRQFKKITGQTPSEYAETTKSNL